MKKQLLIVTIPFWLAACASTPSKTSNDMAEIKPSYNEKVSGLSEDLLKVSVSCPHTSSYQKEDWRKIVSYANACVKAHDWVRTEHLGNYLAVHTPLVPWGAYFMSLAASARKDYPRAQWMLELALKKAPNEGIFHYELGRLDWQTGDDEGALKEMKLASDLNPSLTDAHFIMGQIALRKGNLSDARRLFRKTLDNEPKHEACLLASAEVELKAQDFAKAEDFLQRAIRVNPHSGMARLALAQLQEQHLKKSEEALSNYRELKHLMLTHKIDQPISVNIDERIAFLQKSMAQSTRGSQATSRQPSSERKVAQ